MRLLLLGLFCCSLLSAQAQRNELKKSIRTEVKELSVLYQLDKEQEQAVAALLQTFHLQLEEIAPLKADNQYRTYLYKLKAIREGHQFELKKILRPEQWPAFDAEQARQYQAYLNKLAALKAEGASKEKLELAKITIE